MTTTDGALVSAAALPGVLCIGVLIATVLRLAAELAAAESDAHAAMDALIDVRIPLADRCAEARACLGDIAAD